MRRRLRLIAAIILIALTPTLTVPAQAASRPLVVAHRGASAYAPENTVAAFELARDQGADMVELDVRETRDHHLVLMHDTTLGRTTDAEKVFPGRSPWRVGDLTLAEIRELDAGSWFSRKFAGQTVPTLGEALRAMRGSGLGLLLEIKEPRLYPGIEARVAEEIDPVWRGRIVVQSFDWDSMRRFHRLLPRVPIGLLGRPSAGDLPGLARFADQVNPPYAGVTADYVRRVHRLRMKVLAWTVDAPAAVRRLIGADVDGVITNRPDVVRDLVG